MEGLCQASYCYIHSFVFFLFLVFLTTFLTSHVPTVLLSVFHAIWLDLWFFFVLIMAFVPEWSAYVGSPSLKGCPVSSQIYFQNIQCNGREKKNLIKPCVSKSKNLQCSLDHLTKSVPLLSCHSSVTEIPGNNWILMKVCCASEFQWDVW